MKEEGIVHVKDEQVVIEDEYQVGRETHQVRERQSMGRVEELRGTECADLGLA